MDQRSNSRNTSHSIEFYILVFIKSIIQTLTKNVCAYPLNQIQSLKTNLPKHSIRKVTDFVT